MPIPVHSATLPRRLRLPLCHHSLTPAVGDGPPRSVSHTNGNGGTLWSSSPENRRQPLTPVSNAAVLTPGVSGSVVVQPPPNSLLHFRGRNPFLHTSANPIAGDKAERVGAFLGDARAGDSSNSSSRARLTSTTFVRARELSRNSSPMGTEQLSSAPEGQWESTPCDAGREEGGGSTPN